MATISIPGPAPAVRNFPWRMVEACERVVSAGLLIALGPALVGLLAATWILSGRTPLIAHRRVGRYGRALWMLKLRTMWGDGCRTGRRRGWVEYVEDSGPPEKNPSDPRVSHWLAHFCRQHSVDELPQLWHVLTGEMSLVGPRPLTIYELERYYGADAQEVLRVKPGLAGLWQVSGRNRLSYTERKQLDLQLVRTLSLQSYLRILWKTLPEVWSGANTW